MAHNDSKLVRAAVFATLAVSSITGVWAEEMPAQMQVPITIAAGDLRAALEALVQLTGLQLLFDVKAVEGLRTQGVTAAASPQEALAQLLHGTLLTITVDPSGAILIAIGEPQPLELEEVTVTGTHIRGMADLPMPSITLTRKDFAKSGYSEVADVLRGLPQNLGDLGRRNSGGIGISKVALSNVERASGVNLRGLGPQSTLVLLNGQRRAGSVGGRVFDISAIPLSVIERVEVVTGGRSAIYGSDAVAGVVNIVTRRDFDGAESRAYYGASQAGAAERQLSQIYGRKLERGGFVVSYDYLEHARLDATDAGIVEPPSSGIVVTPGQFDLQPEGTRHAGFISGELDLSDRAELYADALYTSSRNRLGTSVAIPPDFQFIQRQATDNDQYSVASGLHFDVNEIWRVNLAANYGQATQDTSGTDGTAFSSTTTRSTLSSGSVIADGTVLSTRALEIKTAVGVESRREGLNLSLIEAKPLDHDRSIHSAFVEASLSFGDAPSGLRKVQLSIAGRYSDYSDFGSNFDPQLGVVWNVARSLSLRGAYSTAFRAPDLYSMHASSDDQALLRNTRNSYLPGDVSPVLILTGSNPGLEPEQAETWSVGVDYAPAFASGLHASMSYFDIRYDERIEPPADPADWDLVLINDARYPGLLDRNPSAQQVQQIIERALAHGGLQDGIGVPFEPGAILDVFPNLVVFDNRFQNVASERINGLDFMLGSVRQTSLGTLSFDLLATYYLTYERRITATSPVLSQLNAPGKPVDFRVRASVGVSANTIGAFVYLNYVDGYRNPLVTPSAAMDSWTTADLTVRLNSSQLSEHAWLRGVTATFSVRNLLDESPPRLLGDQFGLAYDSANADALGRFVSLEIGKKW